MRHQIRTAAAATFLFALSSLGTVAQAMPIEFGFSFNNAVPGQEGQIVGVFRGLEDRPGTQRATEVEILTNTADPTFGIGVFTPFGGGNFNSFVVTDGQVTSARIFASPTGGNNPNDLRFALDTVGGTFENFGVGTGAGASLLPGGVRVVTPDQFSAANVTIAKVPTPPLLALLAVGLGALVVSRQRGARIGHRA